MRPASHDFGIGQNVWRDVDKACNDWLRKRGLLATQTSEQQAQAQRGLAVMRTRGSWAKLRDKHFPKGVK